MKIKFNKPFNLTPEEIEYQNKEFTLLGMSDGCFLVLDEHDHKLVFGDITNFTTVRDLSTNK